MDDFGADGAGVGEVEDVLGGGEGGAVRSGEGVFDDGDGADAEAEAVRSSAELGGVFVDKAAPGVIWDALNWYICGCFRGRTVGYHCR